MKVTKKISNCLISGEGLIKILDFGMHPYADTFISESQLHLSEPVYPLEVYLNPENGNIQLGYLTNDYDRYNLYSYSYTSSNSEFSRNHWKNLYLELTNRFKIKNKFVVEVGSNDGYLIGMFDRENKILGIDSSKEMCDLSNSKGIRSINRFFNIETSKEVVEDFGKSDVVIANNVFNHSNDPLSFAKAVYNILSDDGIFVCEMPYWLSTVQSGKFDQVYHEHVLYFTVKSIFNLLKKVGLEIFDFEIVDYHGGSIRIYSRKSNDVKILNKISDQIFVEESSGIFTKEFYRNWMEEINKIKYNFLNKIYSIKSEVPNSKIIGIGAAAKANTFLNFYKIDKLLMDYVTDSSPYKIGKYTPLTRIKILSDDIIKDIDNPYVIILSWNISTSLIEKLKNLNKNIKIIEWK